jgi:hypothetical protein
MTCQVKGLVLLPILNISVPSSLKATIHKIFIFCYQINKILTEINQLSVTAKTFAQPFSQAGIHLCLASVTVQSWQADIHGLHEKLPMACSTFRSPLNTVHNYDSPDIRKISQLHYGTVHQSPNHQMC